MPTQAGEYSPHLPQEMVASQYFRATQASRDSLQVCSFTR